MHLDERYGYTVNEIEQHGYAHVFRYPNHTAETAMDMTLAKPRRALPNIRGWLNRIALWYMGTG